VARSVPAVALAVALLAGGIRVFTPEGEPLRQLGRQGEGPGEFRATPRIVEWRDDALLAWDGSRQTWLDLEGSVLSTAVAPRPLQPGQETGINAPEFALAGGGFLYRDSRPETIDQVLVHVSEEGEVRDTLLVIDITSPEARLEVSTGAARYQGSQPFLARKVSVVQPGFRPRPVPATDGAEVWGVFTGDFGVHQLARVRLRRDVGAGVVNSQSYGEGIGGGDDDQDRP
jgi:hypothetical protein